MARRKPSDQEIYTMPAPTDVGLRGCCPRCGEGRLFSGLLTPADRCRNCGLDFAFVDAGDGPAVFVILIIGCIITGLAMAVQSSLAPPIWVHFLLWAPLIIGLSIWGLRFSKGLMIALQYRTKAAEGSLDLDEPSDKKAG